MSKRPPSVRGAVLRFAAVSLLVVLLVAAAGLWALRSIGRSEAVTQAREVARLAGQGIVEPALTDGLLRGDPVALADLDELMQGRVLGDAIIRVRLWTPDGRIVYSDDPRLIGRRFPLAPDVVGVVDTGTPIAEVSDLSAAENALDPGGGEVLEVYLPLRTASGEPLIFETYQALGSVNRTEDRLLVALVPVVLGGVLVLWIVQLPLAWRLARRVQDARRDREALLLRAVEASDAERRRIAADLHDGPVQDLAGLAFSLEATAGRARAGGADAGVVSSVREGASSARRSMRALRSLLVDIHPPTLRSEGLGAALRDVGEPLRAAGAEVTLDVPVDLPVAPEVETLLFRVAREALRNAAQHAHARSVSVRVTVRGDTVRMVVEDDGIGSSAAERAARREDGHMGLRLLEELVAERGGALEVVSQAGEGTRVTAEVPAR